MTSLSRRYRMQIIRTRMQSRLTTQYDFSASDPILRELSNHHDGKFGYVVYRTVYGNDEQWARFMDRMWEFAAQGFEVDARGSEVEEFFDWDVREDEQQLSGATRDQICSLFKEWVASVDANIDPTMPRYCHCIYVDQEVVDAVLNGEYPWAEDYEDYENPRAYVKVLDARYDEETPQYSAEEISDPEKLARMNAGDEGYPEVEDSRRRDVGWYKQSARFLVPRAYHLLMRDGWYQKYVRPPRIGDD